MQTYLDCYPCFIRQTLEAARMAGADEALQRKIICQALCLLGRQAAGTVLTPPEIGCQIHRLVRHLTGVIDPYSEFKQASTQHALTFYPELKQIVRQANDPLDAALRISIAGNIIDFGYSLDYDIEATLNRVLTQPFTPDRRKELVAALQNTDRILYLADNCR